jgi:hypothetical protein
MDVLRLDGDFSRDGLVLVLALGVREDDTAAAVWWRSVRGRYEAWWERERERGRTRT